ncbi:hypothetical protein SBRCBS47491_008447 [Sporothrix bragantina]|uniref:Calpain catalytic domain-containing protein n=1 Tax=Sporothrix bragantina TaxID=671064 RepID=A0ABP0CP48_9PEZI
MVTSEMARTSSPSPSMSGHGSNNKGKNNNHNQNKNKKKKNKNKSPQQTLAEFWNDFQARTPSKITSVFPRRLYTKLQLQPPANILGWQQPRQDVATTVSGVTTPTSTSTAPSTSSWSAISVPTTTVGASTSNAAASYETAAQACRAAVARIVRECHRTNEKFTDPAFNLEVDPQRNCLRGLVRRRMVDGGEEHALQPHHTPRVVHRVDWIFDNPVFAKAQQDEGGDRSGDKKSEDQKPFASSAVQQGRVGDCWWIAAVATIAHRTDLMERLCVARDEMCGVYGFVFQQDGAWFPVVIDDNLYLHYDDFASEKYDATGQKAREHRQRFQRGSEALSFARCFQEGEDDSNETWLPLLEKAFAKAHGDYGALAGGWYSEGVEDLTGGVSTTVVTSRVLDKDRLWRELSSTRGEGNDNDFVFGLSVMGCGCFLANFNGLTVNHCYSVLQAVEAVGEDGKERVRLVKIRNPWGRRNDNTGFGEWHGPWSDGSKEWTPYWLKTLGHTFGDNGVFWMSYQDMLATFGFLHRTRLFDAQWTVVQQWASVGVAWVPGYLGTRFIIDIKVPGLVVVVLSQLDDRYFRGLRGQYTFTLHFVLREVGDDGEILSIVHAPNANEVRSVSCEVNLPTAGQYEVLPQVKAHRNKHKLTEAAVVRETIETNPEKLRQIGQQYDMAHAKGGDVVDEDLVLETRRAKRVDKARAKEAWQKEEKQRAREKKYRDAMEAWVKKRGEQKEKKLEKRRKDKERREGKKTSEEGKEKEEDKEGEKEHGIEDDNSESYTDSDDDDSVVELGPEPRPVPEPNFDSDSEANDSDDLLDDDEDEKDDGARNNSQNDKKDKSGSGLDMLSDINDDGTNNGHGEPGQETVNDTGHSHGHGHGCNAKKNESEEKTPWNAVCVLGLRVYSKDPATTIELVRPDKKGQDDKKQDEAEAVQEREEPSLSIREKGTK